MTGADVLARLLEWGTASLSDGRIVAEADTPPPEELRALVDENRDRVKVAILFATPPAWLVRLIDLYHSGHKTQVKRTWPKSALSQDRFDFGEGTKVPDLGGQQLSYPENLRGGKTQTFEVSVRIKNVCAAVAAEIGVPVLEWERLRPEVEEALTKLEEDVKT